MMQELQLFLLFQVLLWQNTWKKIGADAVIAEGMEAGGHIGKINNDDLGSAKLLQLFQFRLSQLEELRTVKVSLQGFMLGAEAVQVGTRFVVAKGI